MRILIAIIFGICFLASIPAYADCTLAGTAVCNGSPCPGATRPEGRLIYNEDFDVHQVCLDNQWQAVGPIGCPAGDGCNPDPCAGSPTPGTTCGDGSIYAGLSPDGNVPMYTTPADAPGTYNWGPTGTDTMTDCTNGTPGTASTCRTGQSNTTLLAGLGGTYEAADFCDGLSAHGHTDWYLPAQDELDVLYDNRTAIGGFNTSGSFPAGWYWSSSENFNNLARVQRFSDGTQLGNDNFDGVAVRCVRR